jgi:CD163 antigen
VGNTTAREGRVEVYNDGAWGTVCDDVFTDTNARVACFSMGYGSVCSCL